MSNVFPFPPTEAPPAPRKARRAPRSVTLFMHIRRATFIAHLAQPGRCAPETGGERIRRK